MSTLISRFFVTCSREKQCVSEFKNYYLYLTQCVLLRLNADTTYLIVHWYLFLADVFNLQFDILYVSTTLISRVYLLARICKTKLEQWSQNLYGVVFLFRFELINLKAMQSHAGLNFRKHCECICDNANANSKSIWPNCI